MTIGTFTFGVFDKKTKRLAEENKNGFYEAYKVQFPNYITSLQITKINGQVNQYSLSIKYPITPLDDPNFFEKVFSSVSDTRKIVFSYGDATMPTYCYKDEEAIITKVQQTFQLDSSSISYTVSAVSGAALGKSGSYNFIADGAKHKPSSIIRSMFMNDKTYGLKSLFTGMSMKNFDALVCRDDKAVKLETKLNTSALDYITYLVSCMTPEGTPAGNISKDMYVLTIHDDTEYDALYEDGVSYGGPYFKVTKKSYNTEHSDAYEVDIGFNTSTIVRSFSVDNQENYSLYYNYQNELAPDEYVRRIDANGK